MQLKSLFSRTAGPEVRVNASTAVDGSRTRTALSDYKSRRISPQRTFIAAHARYGRLATRPRPIGAHDSALFARFAHDRVAVLQRAAAIHEAPSRTARPKSYKQPLHTG